MTDLPPLAQFLRSRRERLRPAEVGLRDGGRRRTPGLRREEVATLAGVSLDYLVRLEQGRDTNPSPDVLAALASALRLDREESAHLFGLATRASSPHLERLCPAPPEVDRAPPATVQRLLDQLDPVPAAVVGPLTDVVASNRTWRSLAEPIGLLAQPNRARHLFLEDGGRAIEPWDAHADALVARLRRVHRHLEGLDALDALVASLLADDRFARRWAADPVVVREPGQVQLRGVGTELRFDVEVLALEGGEQELHSWLPADAATETWALAAPGAEAAQRPARLRVVGSP